MIASDRIIKIVEDLGKNQEEVSMGWEQRYEIGAGNILTGKMRN